MFKFNKKTLAISTLSLSLATGALLVGCSSNTETPAKDNNTKNEATAKKVDLAKLESDIQNSGLLTFKSTNANIADFPALCEVADKVEEGFANMAMMNVQLQDIAVVKTKDIKAITDALENYLKSHTIQMFGDGYGNEANISSVQNAKIGTVGEYVYFIAAPNTDKIEDLILSNLQ